MAMRLDAYKAVEEKKVALELRPVDSYERAQVDIKNKTQEDIDIDFSRTGFIPVDNSDAQRLGLTYVTGQEPGAYVVSVPAGGGSIQFESRCLDYHRPAPAGGLLYVPMPIPLPVLITEMMRRGVSQQDVWFDIENNPQLQQEWQGLDPRRPELNPGSIPISTTTPLVSAVQVQESDIVGDWEGAHPVQDGSVLRIERTDTGEYKYVGTYAKVGWNLQECKFSVGEVGIWLNPTSTPGEFKGRLKRRYPGTGSEEINDVTTVLSNKNYIVSTDRHGSFESRRV